MKGIILAGGLGSRLWPFTKKQSKQLALVGYQALIKYPLSTLMLAGIRQICVVTTPEHLRAYQEELGDGSELGIELTYQVQAAPRGLPEPFILCRDFIGDQPVAMILGDNIFFGAHFTSLLKESGAIEHGGIVFGLWVDNPRAFGVVEFDSEGRVLSLEEKPADPKSHFMVPGLYFFDSRVCDFAARLTPSAERNELEITHLMQCYLDEGTLHAKRLPLAFDWFDCGTREDLQMASQIIEYRIKRGLWIGCPEQIAWQNGWISQGQLMMLATEYGHSEFAKYLRRVPSLHL